MEEKILEILVRVCGTEEIKNNRSIDLLEENLLDSLAFINLLVILDEELGIEIQPTQVKPDVWRSVDSIIELIEDLAKEKC